MFNLYLRIYQKLHFRKIFHAMRKCQLESSCHFGFKEHRCSYWLRTLVIPHRWDEEFHPFRRLARGRGGLLPLLAEWAHAQSWKKTGEMLLPRMWRPGRDTKAWGPSEVIRGPCGKGGCLASEDSRGDVGLCWDVGCWFSFTGHLPNLYCFMPFILCSFVITAIRKPYAYSSYFLSLYLRSLLWRGFPHLLGRGGHAVQFSSVQSLSRVRLFATPWTAACQASLSITNSRSLPKLMSIESVMPSGHLILCRPLLLLPTIPPSIRVFSNESTLCMRWPKYWNFSFSIIPSNKHPGLISFRIDWLDLLAVQGTLKSHARKPQIGSE